MLNNLAENSNNLGIKFKINHYDSIIYTLNTVLTGQDHFYYSTVKIEVMLEGMLSIGLSTSHTKCVGGPF